MASHILGLDIGGANLKAADTQSFAALRPFELWKNPAGLAAALQHLVPAELQTHYEAVAVTMTGELCDCFANRAEGVRAIVDAVESAFGTIPVAYWRNDGTWATATKAREEPYAVASSNWLALAAFAGRYAPSGHAILIDIGSTTSDLVRLQDGRPVPKGLTDPDRLASGELVYTGVRRTPLCALLPPPFVAELFATTLDAYLLLGEMPEDHQDLGTADGRPATRDAAHARIARMVCLDADQYPRAESLALARQVESNQLAMLGKSLKSLFADRKPERVILSGSGEFLGRKLAGKTWGDSPALISLANKLGPARSSAACAYAVAVLASEE